MSYPRRHRDSNSDSDFYSSPPPGSPFSSFGGWGSSFGDFGRGSGNYDSGWHGQSSYSNSRGNDRQNSHGPDGGRGGGGHHSSGSSSRRHPDPTRHSGSSSRRAPPPREPPTPAPRVGSVARQGRGGFMTMDDLPQEDPCGRPMPRRREPSNFQGRGERVGRDPYGYGPASPLAPPPRGGTHGGGSRGQFAGEDNMLNDFRGLLSGSGRGSPTRGSGRHGGSYGGGGGFAGGYDYGYPSTPPGSSGGGGNYGGWGSSGHGVSQSPPSRSSRHATSSSHRRARESAHSPPPASHRHTSSAFGGPPPQRSHRSNAGGGQSEEDMLGNFANLLRGNGNRGSGNNGGNGSGSSGRPHGPRNDQVHYDEPPRHHSTSRHPRHTHRRGTHDSSHYSDSSSQSSSDFEYDPTAFYHPSTNPSPYPLPSRPLSPEIPRPTQFRNFMTNHTQPYTSSTRPRAQNGECPVCYDEPPAHPCVQIKGKGECKHIIGKECLKRMFELNPDDKKVCPVCRQEWVKEEGEWQDVGLFDEMGDY